MWGAADPTPHQLQIACSTEAESKRPHVHSDISDYIMRFRITMQRFERRGTPDRLCYLILLQG